MPNEVSNRLNIIYGEKNKFCYNFPIKVFWKDGLTSTLDEGNDKKIIYIPQSYLNKLMDDLAEKTEIDVIIENIIIQNKEFNYLNNQFKQDLIAIQKELDALIIDLIYKKKSIDVQDGIIKDLGNFTSVKKNIKDLQAKKDILAKSLDISDKDIKNYDEAILNNIQLSNAVEELKKDKDLIQKKDTIIIFPNNNEINNKDINNKIQIIYNKILQETKNIWNNEITPIISEIDDLISIKNKQIEANIYKLNSLKPKIENNQEIKKIESDLRKEEENVRLIEKEQDVLKALQGEFCEILSKLTNLTTKRETLYDKFVEDFKNLNFENTNESFKIVAKKCRRNVYFKDEMNKIFTQNALKNIHNGVFKDFDNANLIIEDEFDEACKSDFINAILKNNEKKVLLNKYEIEQAVKELLKDYDNVIYTVEMDGDLIESMSPGKKALVLLKLLISLDKSKYPILIDQPEDDLDNLSIVSDLVSFIKERKHDRQIILVTHNANLVLGCDAEEVIVANQEIKNNPKSKNESFQFEYRSGSIENINITNENTFLGSKGIQSHICEILEGGQEAFNTRKNKYTDLKI